MSRSKQSENTTVKLSAKETIKLYIRALKTVWKHFPNYLLSTVLSSLLKAVSPYITLYFSACFLDELAGMRRTEVLFRWVLLVLAMSVAASLLERVFFRWKTAEESCFHVHHGKRIYGRKLLDADFERMDDPDTLDRVTQIERNNDSMRYGFTLFMMHMETFLEAFFKIAGGVLLSWSLFASPVAEQYRESVWLKAVLAGVMAAILLTILLRPLASRAERAVALAYGDFATLINRLFWWYGLRFFETLEYAADIRLYKQEVYGNDILEEVCKKESGQLENGFRRVLGRCRSGNVMLSHLMMGFIYLYVCLKAWFGAFGVGSVTRYVGAVHAVAGGAASILNTMAEAGTNAYYLNKIFEFLDIPNGMYQGSLTVEKRNDRDYEVEFQDVSFRYPNASEYALRHVSMKFRVGERLAVVGENGSGKTTFIKLLCRLYDPTEGRILLNGIDIRKYDYREYLSVFSVVFQDFQLLALELGRNVAAGTDVDAGRARECLGKAGLSDWLRGQGAGLDTRLYKDVYVEEGVELSGGEEQKIAIARSMYRDAPFIILDEPTAALDPVSEHEVYTHFNDIVTDCTAIYISHRLSSCRFCDEIAVFHQGNVIEQGTHEELLEKGGKYSELWNAQAQYYV
ncbi:MAG: ABC transporter ATP-binding protein/permease [Lachnospiraceae bacterium]|nr:ABC transporter ATP-binding protein/permease [Muribaculaceae bacterium]MCM1409752.1 ABC transporter ATP-binding protein/permease [Lachnospiraceae bacterium]